MSENTQQNGGTPAPVAPSVVTQPPAPTPAPAANVALPALPPGFVYQQTPQGFVAVPAQGTIQGQAPQAPVPAAPQQMQMRPDGRAVLPICISATDAATMQAMASAQVGAHLVSLTPDEQKAMATVLERNGFREIANRLRNEPDKKDTLFGKMKSKINSTPTYLEIAVVAGVAVGFWFVYQGFRYLLRDTVDLPRLGGWKFDGTAGSNLTALPGKAAAGK